MSAVVDTAAGAGTGDTAVVEGAGTRPFAAPPGHLHAVDVVRFLTVVAVVAVHSTSLTASPGSDAAGGVLAVIHVTRDVFLLLSAFVLAHSLGRRPLRTRAFWWRRYPLVAIPYAAWSAIYVLTDGDLRSPGHVVATYLVDLLDGGAHFHLYFLLLTFQLYLVFPALFSALACRPRLHVPLLTASLAFELAFTAAVHYGWRPPFLGVWLDHPGSWLPSYELYVVAGLVAALHFDEVTAWVRAHPGIVTSAFGLSVVLAVGSYVLDLTVLRYGPVRASQVFQPVVVVEALAAVALQYSVGLRVADRLADRHRLRRRLEQSADVSLGVYLAHPLLLAGILELAGTLGISAAVASWPSGLTEALVVVGLVPIVYLVVAATVSVLRHTALSLALTGRPSIPSGPNPGPVDPRPADQHPLTPVR